MSELASPREAAGRRRALRAKPDSPTVTESVIDRGRTLSMRHLRFGWWSLFTFLMFGLVLEALHGFKVGWYLEIASSTRRFSWTLCHAHGTLLGVINLIFGATLQRMPEWSRRTRRLASVCLLSATVVLPGGFFLGGLFPNEGDPGLGIFLVPLRGGLLAVSVLLIALNSLNAPKAGY